MDENKILVTARCPVRTTLELVGGKWKLIILQQLCSNPELRLSELKKLIPDISEKMLIQELKILVDSGLAGRKNYGEVPPRVGYSITEKGNNVQSLIEEMVRFAHAYEKN
jgi:DNA-binding HxlR family transcriptional regulator